MDKNNRQLLRLAGLMLFLTLIVGLFAALTKTDAHPLASALNSPLPPTIATPIHDKPVPIPHAYFPTRIPAGQVNVVPPPWVTYEVPGEGLIFIARADWMIASNKSATRYSGIDIGFTDGGMTLVQVDNPEQLPLDVFAKAPASASDAAHNTKWLSADIKQFARDVSNSQYKRLLIVRDDGKEQVTASINGPSKYTVLVAYEQRVLIARSEPDVTIEGEKHFWEVLDSIQFVALQ